MEDKNLLAGYVAMTLKDFNLAQVSSIICQITIIKSL